MEKKLHLRFLIIVVLFFPLYLCYETVTHADTVTDTTTQELKTELEKALIAGQPSLSLVYTGSSATIQSDVKAAYDQIIAADDYLHYSSKGYSYSYKGVTGNLTLTFSFTYWENSSQVDYVNAKSKQILSQIITSNMNEHQKVKAIHDWVILNFAYDQSLVERSAYAGLTKGKTVC